MKKSDNELEMDKESFCRVRDIILERTTVRAMTTKSQEEVVLSMKALDHKAVVCGSQTSHRGIF